MVVREVAHRVGTFERLNAALRELLRSRLGRDPLPRRAPSAGIADSQSIKTTGGVGGEQRGYDANKKVQKVRGTLSATCWWTPRVWCSKPRCPQRQGALPQDGLRLLLASARSGLWRLSQLWLDAGYEGRGRRWAEEAMGLSVEVVRKPPKPLPEDVLSRFGHGNGPRRA